jgi:putative ABC transport system permease protein
VRMALGADAGRVRAMVLKQVGRMTLVGGAIGIIGALALEKTARSLLFGLDGHDPLVVVSAVVVLAVVALGAGYVPARRASKIHPMQALRYE